MKLEVLLVDGRPEPELLADLEHVLALAGVGVQVWLRAEEVELRARVMARLGGDPRGLVFTHPGAHRGHRILHAASKARGALLLALPPGARLRAEGLAALAGTGDVDFVLASGTSPRGSLDLIELVAALARPAHGASPLVAPRALRELGASRGPGLPEWRTCHSVELAPFFAARSRGRASSLGAPLVDDERHVDAEARAARHVLDLAALTLAALHGDPTDAGAASRPARAARLAEATAEGVRALAAVRNPLLNAGLAPTWRPAALAAEVAR